MKTYTSLVKIGLIGLLFLVLVTCKKETPKVLPTLTASPITNIAAYSATAGGEVTADGGDPVITRGVCWSSTNSTPTIYDNRTNNGNGLGVFSSSLTSLTANTTYNIRAYATNSIGTAYYSQTAFKTQALALAKVGTAQITSITLISAISGGEVSNDGYSEVTARGVCWSVNPNPTVTSLVYPESYTRDGIGTGSFVSSISNLRANTKYYLRSYAENRTGISYGDQISFTTLSSAAGTVSDVDGNIYNTLKIGTQIWLKENLRTTKYNDNKPITNITSNSSWDKWFNPAYCWYNNDISYKNTFGGLYNWYAVNTGKLCPTGWHVSSDEEWKTLNLYLGNDAGLKLTEIGGSHWSYSTGRDLIGFTALPGGYRKATGEFLKLKDMATWWVTLINQNYVTNWTLMVYLSRSSNAYEQDGYSIRCIKD